jgi:hypothetical protein
LNSHSDQKYPRGTFGDKGHRTTPTTTLQPAARGLPSDKRITTSGVFAVTEPQIVCPHCSGEFKLTESLAAPIVAETQRRFDALLAEKEAGFATREGQIKRSQEEVRRARETVEEQVANKLNTERVAIRESEQKKARALLSADLDHRDRQLADLQESLTLNNAKLAEAQRTQAEVLRKERELDDAKRELDLAVERKVQEALMAVRDKAKIEVEDAFKTRITEKETQIAGMHRQIEELRRRAEQGSQQLQGEALEIELESLLRTAFPRDTIEPVRKGEFGGDVLHRVFGPDERFGGSIIWESKRTKNWVDGWLGKLRDDQRAAKADVALIVTEALPKGVTTFDLVDKVWVCDPRYAVPLATVLRQSLIAVAGSRLAQEGQQTKMDMVYRYLTGPRFRLRIEAIVEKFTDMQQDLDRERKSTTRLWARREEQLRNVLDATAGLYGDLEGIAGHAMQEIDVLNVRMIENAGT